ncbi:TolB family protein [Sporichthya polymorpha]|uniref:TolB family protein n=1 Tax=Sporichthya polymorpha TaxID=35751 RepID=UPI000377586C|nr:PD40 domain-containing protein [Sporichthya polymorpha]
MRHRARVGLVGALACALACALAVAPGAWWGAAPAAEGAHETLRVSTDGGRGEPNNGSFTPSVSRNGRYVAFASEASNLVPGDTNHRRDIFVRDVAKGTTTRVSVSSRGRQGNLDSYNPSISDDGRFVVFDSFATNLVPDDLNREGDVFVHDLVEHTTTRVSRGIDGKETDASSGFATISGDGNVIAFESSATNLRAGRPGKVTDIYLVDRAGNVLDWVTRSPANGEPNGGSGDIALSRDGQVVAFASAATNLVPGDTNLADDVFVRDRRVGWTQRVSVNSLGGETNDNSGAPSISDDGRIVVFSSNASSLVSLVPGTQSLPAFVFHRFHTGDDNFVPDVFVHDRVTRRTEIVSVSTEGAQGIAESYEASVSGDGTKVAFASYASDLVPGDGRPGSEIFLRDLTNRRTTRLSVDGSDHQGNGTSVQPAISGDGNWVAFTSDASNLVRGDRNRSGDVFLRH